jgi:hypothetical protein
MASIFDPFQVELLKQLNEVGNSYRSSIRWLNDRGVDAAHQSLWSWHVRKMKKLKERAHLQMQLESDGTHEVNPVSTLTSDELQSTPNFFPTVKTVGTGQSKRGIGSIILEEQRMLDNLGPLGYSGFVAKKGKF